jgi:thiol-disulfide isomerase/thioredoxin
MQNQEVRDALAGIRRRLSLLGSRIDLRGETLAGKTLDVTDMRGRVVLVEFWSTTCGPCIQEIPELKSIYRAYHDRGFEIIGIPLDRFPGGLTTTLEEHGIRWPQLWRSGGNRERMRSLGITSIPSSLLLDRNGRVIALDVRAAAAASEKRLEAVLRALFRS